MLNVNLCLSILLALTVAFSALFMDAGDMRFTFNVDFFGRNPKTLTSVGYFWSSLIFLDKL